MILPRSLRGRLMVLILAPLATITVLLGYWRYTTALATAEELFDRSLLAATLAVSRDVAISGGDALSITTRDLIAQAAGGQVFYHVAGPDRAYITGYAYPPVPPADLDRSEARPIFYESLYRREPVRALRLLEQTEAGPIRGLTAVTVWQRRAGREGLARHLALQSAILLATVLISVAVIIWLSVNRGLRPLLDLEDAIAARNTDDLTAIRREVPTEVRGIVSTLNALFGQVRDALRARDAFISDAAHQLRNPVAGMLALAESAESAGTEAERRERLAELKSSARRTARLTTQMLAFERIRGQASTTQHAPLDLDALARAVAARNAERALGADIEFEYRGPDGPAMIEGDEIMLEEAVENLIDNALCHGPPELTSVQVEVKTLADGPVLTVADDGRGLSPDDAPTALKRFGQVRPSEGSGLGLAIAAEIAAKHGAKLTIDEVPKGASVSLVFRQR